ncbi:hypothetical protein FCI58_03425, partial [Enterobacter hormaechei]|nr:hypothetical protein [Enterobacter hormaechei]
MKGPAHKNREPIGAGDLLRPFHHRRANGGISIKLSALHPRYSRAQYDRVMEELYPRLKSLTLLAR